MKDVVLKVIRRHPEIALAVLFGSAARGSPSPESDLDLGVAAAAPLHAGDKEILISDLAAACGRPIDLIDLQTAGLPILTEILTTGTVIHRSDELLHAALVRRMIFDNEDFGRYRRRILAERRAQWIAE